MELQLEKKNNFSNVEDYQILNPLVNVAFRKLISCGSEPLTKEEFEAVGKSPNCWKCYRKFINYMCEGCGRSFHRFCAFPTDGFRRPMPVFDKPLYFVKLHNAHDARLMQCYECQMAVTTHVAHMKDIRQEELNFICSRVIESVEEAYSGSFFRCVINNEDQMDIITIMGRSKAGEYKTIEGFYADVNRIVFDSIRWYGAKTDVTELAKSLRHVANEELQIFHICPECYLRRWDQHGNPIKSKERGVQVTALCKEPHAVCWVKMPRFSFWPAKMLAYDTAKKKAFIQCFGDGTKCWLDHDQSLSNILTFSKELNRSSQRGKGFRAALQDANRYLKNVGDKFGFVVNVPWDPTPFSGNVEDVKRHLFPQYYRNVGQGLGTSALNLVQLSDVKQEMPDFQVQETLLTLSQIKQELPDNAYFQCQNYVGGVWDGQVPGSSRPTQKFL